jgi:TfoX/Sxy family transcriptional regulator of competence genes
MAFNEKLADAAREQLLKFKDDITEKKMFGGISFLYKGKMAVGVLKNDLVVRVIASKIEHELEKHNVRPMDFTKKPMKEFIFVEVEDIKNLPYWIDLGIEHAKSKLINSL